MSPAKKNVTIKADAVVIGGAGTGMAAAVAAAEKGVKVVIVEKRPSLGGNSTVSGAFFACESPSTGRAEIDAPADHFFKKAMEFHHWKVNPRIVRAFIAKSGKTIKWLEDKGLPFTATIGASIIPEHDPRIQHRPTHGGSPGGEICKLLESEVKRLGCKVLLNTKATSIIKEKGKILGCVAEDDGNVYRIEAKATMICTGGYPNNKAMIKKYNPGFNMDSIYVGIPEVVGEGLEMALKVGIGTEALGYVHYMGLHFPGNSAVISRTNWFPENLWVNRKGLRFCDEAVVFDMGTRGNVLEKQPGCMAYVIFDTETMNMYIENHREQSAQTETAARARWVDLPKDLQAEAKKGNVGMGNEIADLAKYMKVPVRTLKATINEYNKACQCGYDPLFLKDKKYMKPILKPPFYAVKNGSDYPCTVGGIKINENMEVVNKNDDVIPGLYCAGTDAGGWESETYCFYLFGSILAWRIVSGQMAGESIAKYLGK